MVVFPCWLISRQQHQEAWVLALFVSHSDKDMGGGGGGGGGWGEGWLEPGEMGTDQDIPYIAVTQALVLAHPGTQCLACSSVYRCSPWSLRPSSKHFPRLHILNNKHSMLVSRSALPLRQAHTYTQSTLFVCARTFAKLIPGKVREICIIPPAALCP